MTTVATIDDTFIREWGPKYDQTEHDEPEYQNLLTAVARDICLTGTLSKDTFLSIWKWKGAMRVIRHVKLDEYDALYATAFRKVLTAPPEQKLHVLLEPSVKLPGVETPTGSTIIHFMHPDLMPIIDVRTAEVLLTFGLVSTDRRNLRHYEEFRRAMDSLRRRCPGWTLRQIDKALFAYHKQVLDQNSRSRRCRPC
jgi:hypothetical protein